MFRNQIRHQASLNLKAAGPQRAPAPAKVFHPDGSSISSCTQRRVFIITEEINICIFHSASASGWGDVPGGDASSVLSFICGYLESGLEKKVWKNPQGAGSGALLIPRQTWIVPHVFIMCSFISAGSESCSTAGDRAKLAPATHFCDYSPCLSPDCSLLRLLLFLLFTCANARC